MGSPQDVTVRPSRWTTAAGHRRAGLALLLVKSQILASLMPLCFAAINIKPFTSTFSVRQVFGGSFTMLPNITMLEQRASIEPVRLGKQNVTLEGFGSRIPKEICIQVWETSGFDVYYPNYYYDDYATTNTSGVYSALFWQEIPKYYIWIDAGQALALKAMAINLYEFDDKALTGSTLAQLAPSYIRLAPTSTLLLENVTLLLRDTGLRQLLKTLCSPGNWVYNAAVEISYGIMRIHNMTSNGQGLNGTPGTGGLVRWSNVTLRFIGLKMMPPLPCSAKPVASGSELYSAAHKALLVERAATVLLSVIADVALPEDGSWKPIPISDSQQLILLGNPDRIPALNLAALADVWTLDLPVDDGAAFAAMLANGNSEYTTLADYGSDNSNNSSSAANGPLLLGNQPTASLYDLVLVNLPQVAAPVGPMTLLSVAMHSFKLVRGFKIDGYSQVKLTRCTVVVPDQELDFLSATLDHNSSNIWPWSSPGDYVIERASVEPSSRGSPQDVLVLRQLKLRSEVFMSNCTLLSATSYRYQPPAPTLLANARQQQQQQQQPQALMPQSLSWMPQLLAPFDNNTVGQWGLGGLEVTSDVMQALTALEACDSRSGYSPTVLIWRANAEGADGSFQNSTRVNISRGGPLAPAATCAVDGAAMGTSLDDLSGGKAGTGRAFADLQGDIQRFSLARPITLRNLVLYNLSVPTRNRQLQRLRAADVPWASSTLPLWLFDCPRSDQDLKYMPTAEERAALGLVIPQLLGSDPARDSGSGYIQLQPRVVLENVTLVIPKREWWALVAAVLLYHAPEAMAEVQRRPRQPTTPPSPRRMVAGPPPLPPILNPPPHARRRNTSQIFRPETPLLPPNPSPATNIPPRPPPWPPFRPDVPYWPSKPPSPAPPLSADDYTSELSPPSPPNRYSVDPFGDLLGGGGAYEDPSNIFPNTPLQPTTGGSPLPPPRPPWPPSNPDVPYWPHAPSPEHRTHPSSDYSGSSPPSPPNRYSVNPFGYLFGGAFEDPSNIFPNTPLQLSSPLAGAAAAIAQVPQHPYPPANADVPPRPAMPLPPQRHSGSSVGNTGSGDVDVSKNFDDMISFPDVVGVGVREVRASPRRTRHSRSLRGAQPGDSRSLTAPSLPPQPQPPYTDTTRVALQAFAAASTILSYNYSSGELVLSSARHYGWSGTNVTITYKMPQDAPASALLLSYPDIRLPYDELADLVIDVQLPPPTAPVSESAAPGGSDDSGSNHHWLIPVVASVVAVGGALLLGGVVTSLVILYRRRLRDRGLANRGAPSLKEVSEPRGQNTGDAGADCVMLVLDRPHPLDGHAGAAAAVPTGGVTTAQAAQQRSSGAPSVEIHLQQSESTKSTYKTANSSLPPLAAAPPSLTGPQQQQADHIHGQSVGMRTEAATVEALDTITCKANRIALARALACSGTSDGPGVYAAACQAGSGREQAAAGSVAKAGQVDIAASADQCAFKSELQAYFRQTSSTAAQVTRQCGEADREDGNDEQPAPLAAQPTTAAAKRPAQAPRPSISTGINRCRSTSSGMSRAIQTLQAELRDTHLHLESIIGTGAFGAVYRGVWRGLPVAVKTMVVANDPSGASRTRQKAVLEAAISLSMSHPNVVATFTYDIKPLVQADAAAAVTSSTKSDSTDARKENADNFDTEEQYDAVKLYIIQEYCNGGTLREALKRSVAGSMCAGGVQGLVALQLALDIAMGMRHIHSRRIVHGDLKPENVLLVVEGDCSGSVPSVSAEQWGTTVSSAGLHSAALTAAMSSASGASARQASAHDRSAKCTAPNSGGDGEVGECPKLVAKVADFGLSLPLTEGATHASHCYNGTAAYTAPEVLTEGRQSPRADVWSYGLILLELYYGCSLNTMYQVYVTVLMPAAAEAVNLQLQPRAFFQDVLTSISDRAFAGLAGRCLSMEPRDRPDFNELVQALTQMHTAMSAGMASGSTAAGTAGGSTTLAAAASPSSGPENV